MAELKRVKLMRGNEASRLSVIPAQGEQISTIDELKLYLGDGNKAGGFIVNADNTIAVWPDQTDATKKLSLAWWIAYFNGSEATVRIPRGTHEVLYDMTIPENICLKFDKGANLKVSDTKTLTINGAIEAGPWQIFSGDGVIAGTPKVESIYIEWFGAVGDGVTDSTNAIQTACDLAESEDGEWVYDVKPKVSGSPGEYLISETIHIKSACALSQVKILADGTTINPAVRIGYNEDAKWLSTAEINAPAVMNYKNGEKINNWAGTGIGMDLCNLDQCKVYVPWINGFQIGLQCCGYYQGFAYTYVQIGIIDYAQICLKLTRVSDGSNIGWCNENTFENGRFNARALGTDWTGTRNILIEQGNNNLFLKPSVESASVEYCMEFVAAAYCTFLNGRYEGVGAKRILFNPTESSGVTSLLFIGGYELEGINFTNNTTYEIGYVQVLSRYPYLGYNVAVGYGGFTQGSDNLNSYTSTDQRKKTAYHLLNNSAHFYRYEIPDPPTDISTDFDIALGYYGLEFAKNRSDPTGAALYLIDESTEEGTAPGKLCVKCATFLPRKNDGTTGDATLGQASLKWDTVYAVNGTIQTSDERAKTEISSIPDEWLDAWGDVDYTRFKMVDAVQKKGSDNARWHIGLIAQRVKEAFEARGLDAMQIGLLCYDEWDDIYEDIEVIDSEAVMDEEGNIITPEVKHTETVHSQTAGSLYSIRYDEALAMEAAYMRREVERLKSSINV